MTGDPAALADLRICLRRVWSELLDVRQELIDEDRSFFELGGDSLLVAELVRAVNRDVLGKHSGLADSGIVVGISDVFEHPTLRQFLDSMAARLQAPGLAPGMAPGPDRQPSTGMAIIGMSGRFPQASSVDAFWRNICAGRESVATYSDAELLAAGVAETLLAQPAYVKCGGLVDSADCFDPEYFGLSAREAALSCPQQRLMLECAEEALQDGGYGVRRQGTRVGVFIGAGRSIYCERLSRRDDSSDGSMREVELRIINTAIASRISYLLDLTGPSFSLDTACSSSLVAVHAACRALRQGECDMALAGGVSIKQFGRAGYRYQEGGVVAPDGHCRPFDAKAAGTVFTNGAGIVLLKPLSTALAHRDHVYAVIRGSSINNDGRTKMSYAAPAVAGQAQVIHQALADARIPASAVQYIEAHGTGTDIGDPIEVAALCHVFHGPSGSCALGSVKSNIGHMEAAAGIAGLIKASLSLHHRTLTPTINFNEGNRHIRFNTTPFYVNTQLRPWESQDQHRRHAGVSSFGIGGTNAHVILEEAPQSPAQPAARKPRLFVLSGGTQQSVTRIAGELADLLERHGALDPADVSYTLRVGRRTHRWRRALVCETVEELATELREIQTHPCPADALVPRARLVFLFPGQGSQYVGMARTLYDAEPVFRQTLDRCAEILRAEMSCDIRELVCGSSGGAERAAAEATLRRTEYAQPAMFAVEYALAALWRDWGVHPDALLGHSLGEYVAACAAGVWSLPDALHLVTVRGRLMQKTPPGGMLAVALGREDTLALLGDGMSLAAVNGARSCVVAGPREPIARLRDALVTRGIPSRELNVRCAFHSQLMQGITAELSAELSQVPCAAPAIPLVSNIDGNFVAAESVKSPGHWLSHALQTVEFAQGVSRLVESPGTIFLEIGPGVTLKSLVSRIAGSRARAVLDSMGRAQEGGAEYRQTLRSLGRLWELGVVADLGGRLRDAGGGRVPLPTYPFEKIRCWMDAPDGEAASHSEPGGPVHAARAGRGPCANATADDGCRAGGTSDVQAAADRRQDAINAIWGELLGTDAVDVRRDFFEAGGDSLLAARFVAELNSRLGVTCSIKMFLENPTIGGACAVVAQLS